MLKLNWKDIKIYKGKLSKILLKKGQANTNLVNAISVNEL